MWALEIWGRVLMVPKAAGTEELEVATCSQLNSLLALCTEKN